MATMTSLLRNAAVVALVFASTVFSQSTTASAPTTANTGVCTTTGSVSPNAPVCPGSSGQSFISPCGSNYTVTCNSDADPAGSATNSVAASLSACIAQCDAYAGCRAATFTGSLCYLKTSFTGLTNTGTSQALVRYIPPNPAYAVPFPAGSVNASSGCGKALPAGLVADGASVQYSVVTADGNTRIYRVHIPKFYDPLKASPLIFGFPGASATALEIESQTRFNDATLNPYGIAVYVQGVNLGFQSNPNNNNIDDIGLVKALVANMTASFCVDTGRIWAAGFSNGGGFANVLACNSVTSSLFSVFAMNSGAFYTGVVGPGDPATVTPVDTPVEPCTPSRQNIPIVEVHGTGDTTINYYGEANRNNRVLPTIPRWTNAWATRQGYSTTNITTNPATGLTKYVFGNSDNLGIITQYTLAGWTHTWARIADGAPLDSSPTFMNFFYDQTSNQRAVAAISSSSSTTSTSNGIVGSSTAATTSSMIPSSSSVTTRTTLTFSASQPGLSCTPCSNSSTLGLFSSTTSSPSTSSMSSSVASSMSSVSSISTSIFPSVTSLTSTPTSLLSTSTSSLSTPSSSISSTTSSTFSSSASSSIFVSSTLSSTSSASTTSKSIVSVTRSTSAPLDTSTSSTSRSVSSGSSNISGGSSAVGTVPSTSSLSSSSTFSSTRQTTPSSTQTSAFPSTVSSSTTSSSVQTSTSLSAFVTASSSSIASSLTPTFTPSSSVRTTLTDIISSTAPTSSVFVLPTTSASGDISTTSDAPQPTVYPPPPACPTDTGTLCAPTDTTTTCSSDSGQAYNVTCGFAYVGTPIQDSDVKSPPPYDNEPFVPPTATPFSGPSKRDLEAEFELFERRPPFAVRVLLPDIKTCQAACELSNTTEQPCVAFNYDTVTYNCTIFSEVTGTVQSADIIAAEPVPNPPTAVEYSTYATTTASTLFSTAATTTDVSMTSTTALADTNPASSFMSSSSAQPTPTGLVTSNGFCGPLNGGAVCGLNFGDCCSQFGACGNTTEYCGDGCDPRYGRCGSLSSTVFFSTTLGMTSSAMATSIPGDSSSAVRPASSTLSSVPVTSSLPSMAAVLPTTSSPVAPTSSSSAGQSSGGSPSSPSSEISTSSSSIASQSGIISTSTPGDVSSGLPPPNPSISTTATTFASFNTPSSSMSPSITTQSASPTVSSCPTDTADICSTSNTQIVCSSNNETTYAVTCGIIYTGNEIPDDRANTTGLARRFYTDTFGDCQQACTDTSECLALNYVDSDCTLFDSVNGTSLAPGAVSAYQVPDDGVVPSYSLASSQVTSSTRVPSLPTSYTGPSLTTSGISFSATSPSSMLEAPSSLAEGSSTTEVSSTSPPGAPSYSGDAPSSTRSISSLAPLSPTPGTTSASGPVSLPSVSFTSGPTTSSTPISGGGLSPSRSNLTPASSDSASSGAQSSAPTAASSRTASSSQATGSALPSGSASITSPIYPSDSGSFATSPTASPRPSTSAPTPSPIASLCPASNGQNYTSAQGVTYSVACDTALTGNTYSANQRRQSSALMTAESCMAYCNSDPICLGVNITPQGCVYFSSITGSTPTLGTTALEKIALSPNPSGGQRTVTISVCSASTTRTITAFTTVSIATCEVGSACPTRARIGIEGREL